MRQKRKTSLLVLLLPVLTGTLLFPQIFHDPPFPDKRPEKAQEWRDPREVMREANLIRKQAERMRKEFLAANRRLRLLRHNAVVIGLTKMTASPLLVIPYRYLLEQGKCRHKRRTEARKKKVFLIHAAEERLFTNVLAQPFSP